MPVVLDKAEIAGINWNYSLHYRTLIGELLEQRSESAIPII